MKKTISLILTLLLSLSLAVSLLSCSTDESSGTDNKKDDKEVDISVVGEYKLYELTGYATNGESTETLDESIIDTYTFTLNSDGTGFYYISGSYVSYDQRKEFTWEYDNPTLKITTTNGAMRVTQEMTLVDGFITMETSVAQDNAALYIKVVFQKNDDESPVDDIEVAGTYEMVDLSGSIISGSSSTAITMAMFDYYTIVLNEDGTGTVKSRGAGQSAVESDLAWELEGTTLRIIANQYGVQTTEEMTLENGIITYEVIQNYGEGTSMSMNIVFEKQ